MNNELISVIIPVYKVEKYLDECIQSVINQTYKNLEIILVDDGSPDNCGKICDEYAKKDNRIKVIHKENGGLSSARNAGLDIARGEYISFIDSDDYVSKDFIKNMSIQMANADLIICGMKNVYKEDEKCDEKENVVIKNETLTFIEANQKLIKPKNEIYVTACNKLYRRELFDNLRFEIR